MYFPFYKSTGCVVSLICSNTGLIYTLYKLKCVSFVQPTLVGTTQRGNCTILSSVQTTKSVSTVIGVIVRHFPAFDHHPGDHRPGAQLVGDVEVAQAAAAGLRTHVDHWDVEQGGDEHSESEHRSVLPGSGI